LLFHPHDIAKIINEPTSRASYKYQFYLAHSLSIPKLVFVSLKPQSIYLVRFTTVKPSRRFLGMLEVLAFASEEFMEEITTEGF
jgi:hypothetical protein